MFFFIVQTEVNDKDNVKDRESATEASDAALSIAKEAIVSMKDADNTNSLTPKQENQKAELNDTINVKDHEPAMDVSDVALSVLNKTTTPEATHVKTEMEDASHAEERESAMEASDEASSLAKLQ
ncbi:hypothetical protein Hanom_Chr01g00013431 [Helianthus anomalus]